MKTYQGTTPEEKVGRAKTLLPEANLSLRFVAHGSEAFVANLQRRLSEARQMLIEVLGPSNMYVYRSKLLSAQIFCKRGDRQTLTFIE